MPPLLSQVRASLIKFNLPPSKIIKGNQIFLSRKEDIILYQKIIGFSNRKHLNRIKNFRNLSSCSLVVKDSALSNRRGINRLDDALSPL